MDKQEALKAKGYEKRKVVNFVGDVKQEFKKIEWTGREELILYTKIVLASTFIFGMGVYFVDLIIQSCLSSIQGLVRIIFG